MANKIKVTQKIIEGTKKIEELLLIKLLEEEPMFTGKFVIEVNCSQGGVTSIDAYTLRKID